MENKYLGEYRSAGGCGKVWISEAQGDLNFPPQVVYTCDLCKATHNFRLYRTYTLVTPGQEKQFREYCATNNFELDVSITE